MQDLKIELNKKGIIYKEVNNTLFVDTVEITKTNQYYRIFDIQQTFGHLKGLILFLRQTTSVSDFLLCNGLALIRKEEKNV